MPTTITSEEKAIYAGLKNESGALQKMIVEALRLASDIASSGGVRGPGVGPHLEALLAKGSQLNSQSKAVLDLIKKLKKLA